MKNLKIIIFAFLLFFAQNLNAQTEIKTPREFFIMLFDAFVKNDQNSLKNLNDYGSQAMNEENIYTLDNEDKEEYLKKFLAAFPENTISECKKEAEDFFNVIDENFKNGKLTIKSSKIEKNERTDETAEEIVYSVSFKIPSKLSNFEFEGVENIKADKLKNFLIQATKELKSADKIVTTEDESATLYQKEKEGKIFYFSVSPDRIVSELQGFYFYSLEKASAMYQEIE